MSAITDIAILVIPIPLIRNLHMPLKKKIRVFGMLGAGGVAVAASLARLVMVVSGGDNPDLTFSIVRFNLLGLVCFPSHHQVDINNLISRSAETSIGLICASLPVCSAFFAHYGGSLFSSSKPSKSKSSDPTADVELGTVGSKRSRKLRSLPTWVDEDNGSDSDVLMTNSQEPGEIGRKDTGGEERDRKNPESVKVSIEGDGEIGAAR